LASKCKTIIIYNLLVKRKGYSLVELGIAKNGKNKNTNIIVWGVLIAKQGTSQAGSIIIITC